MADNDELDIIEGVDEVPDTYVVYEMRIRQQNLGRSTLASRKRRLIEILKREKETGELMQMIFHLPLEEDLAECEVLLSIVKENMNTNLNRNATRCEVQLIFLKERLERLPISPRVAIATMRTDLLNEIEELEKQFANVTVASGLDERPRPQVAQNTFNDIISQLNLNSAVGLNATNAPRHSSTNRTFTTAGVSQYQFQPSMPLSSQVGTSVHNISVQSQPPNSSVLSTAIPNTPVFHRPQAQMWKWNVVFSGEEGSVLASGFIQKIKEMARSRAVADTELLNGMSELLSGAAANWYRTNSRDKPFTNFDDFCSRLLEDFEPFYRVDTRLELLKKRLQKSGERIVAFFAHVENEFHALSITPPVEEQIRIIRRLLLPHFITHLACRKFQTVYDLKSACKDIELSYEIVRSQQTVASQENYNAPAANANHSRQQNSGGHQNQQQQIVRNNNPNRYDQTQNRYDQNPNKYNRFNNPFSSPPPAPPADQLNNNNNNSRPFNNSSNQVNNNVQTQSRNQFSQSFPPNPQPTFTQKPPGQHVHFQNNSGIPNTQTQYVPRPPPPINPFYQANLQLQQQNPPTNRHNQTYQEFSQRMNSGQGGGRSTMYSQNNSNTNTLGQNKPPNVATLIELTPPLTDENVSDMLHESMLNINHDQPAIMPLNSTVESSMNLTMSQASGGGDADVSGNY